MNRTVAIGAACLIVAVLSYAAVHRYFISDEPYKAAVAFISTHPTVVAEVGAVQNVGLSWLANFSISGSGGEAGIECPITGEKGQGRVALNLKRVGGAWRVTDARLVTGDDRRVPLQVSP